MIKDLTSMVVLLISYFFDYKNTNRVVKLSKIIRTIDWLFLAADFSDIINSTKEKIPIIAIGIALENQQSIMENRPKMIRKICLIYYLVSGKFILSK